MMTKKRMICLYNNMLNYISEVAARNDLRYTLEGIGFTEEEIREEFGDLEDAD